MWRVHLFWLWGILFLTTPLQADYVVVEEREGQQKRIYGRIHYRKRHIVIETLQGKKWIPWKKVVAFYEYPLSLPYSPEKKETFRKIWKKKVEKILLSKDVGQLYRLALWAKKRRMEDEAKWAFQKILEWNPHHSGARRELQFVEEQGQWVPLSQVFTRRWQALPRPLKRRDLLSLSRWCLEKGLYPQAESLVRTVLRRNNYDRAAIRLFRRLTARHRPQRKYIFPFKGRFRIIVDKTRHHQLKCFAIWAYDIMKVDDEGRLAAVSRPSECREFFSWNEPIYAIGDGVVKYVEDHNPDNPVGKLAPFEKVNRILIDHGGGEFSFYCHLKQNSAVVKVGDKVRRGQMIGRIGNSGASAVPHLHFTLMDKDYFSLPVWFENLTLYKKGRKIEIRSAKLEEGWIVESQFQGYFQK